MVMRECLIVRWWWWQMQWYLYFGSDFGRGCQIKVNRFLLLLLLLFKLSFWINMHLTCHGVRETAVLSYTFLRRESLPVFFFFRYTWNPGLGLHRLNILGCSVPIIVKTPWFSSSAFAFFRDNNENIFSDFVLLLKILFT